MSLSIRNEQNLDIWNNSCLPQIKEIYGKNLSTGEFETFVQLGRATGLNPFLREIWAVKYNNSPAQIFIGRDGYRKSAQASPQYDYHQVDAVYDNDDFHFDLVKGEVNHHYNFKDRGKLMGAYCLVKRKNSTKPIFVFVDVNEYNKNQSVWKEKPATMIKKVAEAQGLRMAFQELFGGTYDQSEDWRNKNIKQVVHTKVENARVIDYEDIDDVEMDYQADLGRLKGCSTVSALGDAYKTIVTSWKNRGDRERVKKINVYVEVRKKEIEKSISDFNDEIDAETGEVKNAE